MNPADATRSPGRGPGSRLAVHRWPVRGCRQDARAGRPHWHPVPGPPRNAVTVAVQADRRAARMEAGGHA